MQSDIVERLTRPIIGIENRTGQEAFDIMADRIRHALRAITNDAPVERLVEALKPFARLAEPINGEAGRPTYLEASSGPNGTDELLLSTHVGDGTRTEVLDAEDFRRALAALSSPSGEPAVGEERYAADRFEWAAPGDQQEDAWLVRFCDKDCREAIFTGPDAEREAWEHYERYAPAFNLYVFRLARLKLTPTAPVDDTPPSGLVKRESFIERARNMLDARGIGPDTVHGPYVGHDDIVEVVADALSSAPTAPVVPDREEDDDRAELGELLAAWREAKRKGLRVLTFGLFGKPAPSDTADRREAIARVIRRYCQHGVEPEPHGGSLDTADLAADDILSLIAGPLPEGFVAVPVEPNEAMARAGIDARSPIEGIGPNTYAVYRAMIASRPTGEQE